MPRRWASHETREEAVCRIKARLTGARFQRTAVAALKVLCFDMCETVIVHIHVRI
jgi:hypothetical protein